MKDQKVENHMKEVSRQQYMLSLINSRKFTSQAINRSSKNTISPRIMSRRIKEDLKLIEESTGNGL